MPPVLVDPFAPHVRALDDPAVGRAQLRSAGPVVRVRAPAGGYVWIVTDDATARAALADPRISKDTAHAPAGWDPRRAELEPTAAQQPSLTTFDGAPHAQLRRAHAPLLSARRVQQHAGRITEIARGLLAALADGTGPVDLTADFTTRYPLTVLCDLLGVPLDRVDDAVAACRGMYSDDPAEVGRAMAGFGSLAAAALCDGQSVAAALRDRLPAGTSEQDLGYFVFTLLFAGQLTTDATLGFLVARLLRGDLAPDADTAAVEAFVADVLRRDPPAPFTLWRFTTAEVELAGVRLPTGAPVLVDIAGINGAGINGAGINGAGINAAGGPDLSFGAGPHYCIGAQLAALELRVVVEVLRAEHPDATLAVPYAELRRAGRGGLAGCRVTTLPVLLSGRAPGQSA